jgi:UDP-N-acetylglucosamine 1-carboxyvinyltransferase
VEKFVIEGGNRLVGEVTISGAKNAVVAILPAVLLSDDVCRIENIPNISDVSTMIKILYEMGAGVRMINPTTVEIDPRHINSHIVGYELTRKMRASYYLIGALLGRFSRACVAMPGGCDFGVRPIDQHIRGFEALGAKVTMEKNAMVNVEADMLIGTSINMDVVSVGATINLMLAAVKANGLTVIENAAKEPHIVDLANFLNTMGADVRGAGTDVIKIYGVKHLHGCTYSIIPDQIEAGTFMVAAAAAGGRVHVRNIIPKHLESITAKLEECGVSVIEDEDGEGLTVSSNGVLHACTIRTLPHPGFPTDMQPQMTVLLSVAEGESHVSESVWDNRFKYVDQLLRMGANIRVDGKVATINGVKELHCATVHANDLRAGAAMVIAGLIASGTTIVENIEYIDRGYDDIVGKLTALGADIKRVNFPDDAARMNSVG